MKRIIAVAAVIAATGTWLVGTAAAGQSTEPNKACADIVGGRTSMVDAGSNTSTVSLRETLAAPACKNVNYEFVVTNPTSGAVIGTSSSPTGTGTDADPLVFSVSVNNADAAQFNEPQDANTYPLVCVYGTTSGSSGHVLDRAPDSGCFQLSTDPYFSPGGLWR